MICKFIISLKIWEKYQDETREKYFFHDFKWLKK